MEVPSDKKPLRQSTRDNPSIPTGNHSADEAGTGTNRIQRDNGSPLYSQDGPQRNVVFPSIDSPENDGVSSNRPSPVIQHVQGQSGPMHGTLRQPSLIDGSAITEPRLLIKKKGRFTVTPDAPPSTPKIAERSASFTAAQTTPAAIQKGRFTVTPDMDAVPILISSDNSVATVPIFVAPVAAVVPPKVEKKGRFVVSSPVPSVGMSVDSGITLPQTLEHSSSVATVPQNPTNIESLGVQPPPAPLIQIVSTPVPVASVAPTDQTAATPSGLEEKSTIMSGSSGVARLGKPPASFDSKGVGSNIGLGKVFYFLDQMKSEVSEADRHTKLLQKEVKFLKEKNKELEAKSREMEKRWKDQQANREAAEAKIRLLKKTLKELKDGRNEDELLGESIEDTHSEIEKSSRSSSIGDADEMANSNSNGYQSDSVLDGLEKLAVVDGSPGGVQSRRRPSNDGTGIHMMSKAGSISSVDAEKAHSAAVLAATAGGSGPQKLILAATSRPPMAESRHARHWSGSSISAGNGNTLHLVDDGSQTVVHPTHKRASSNSEACMISANVSLPCMIANGAVEGNCSCPQQNQPPALVVQQKPQQAWNQGQYPIMQQQSLQKPPISNSQQGAGINHQVIQQGIQQQPQQGIQFISQRQPQQVLQVLNQQQPHGVTTLLPQQQQLGMPPLTHQQSVQAAHSLPQQQSSPGMSIMSQPPQPAQTISLAQQKSMTMQPQAFVTQQQSHTPQKLQGQSVLSHPQSLTQQQQQGLIQPMKQHPHNSPLKQQTQQQQLSTQQQHQPTMLQLPTLQRQHQQSQSQSLQQQSMQHQQQQQQQGPLPIQTMPGTGGSAPVNQQQQPFSAQFNTQQQQSMQQPSHNGLQWS